MKRYQYHSNGTGSVITLTYINGLLQGVELEPYEAHLDTNARAQFFISEVLFLKSCQQHKLQYTEIGLDITFDMFWERYGYKTDKALAMEAWQKMSKDDQVKAYNFIPRYNSQLKSSGLARKYAVRYLKHKPWIQ